MCLALPARYSGSGGRMVRGKEREREGGRKRLFTGKRNDEAYSVLTRIYSVNQPKHTTHTHTHTHPLSLTHTASPSNAAAFGARPVDILQSLSILQKLTQRTWALTSQNDPPVPAFSLSLSLARSLARLFARARARAPTTTAEPINGFVYHIHDTFRDKFSLGDFADLNSQDPQTACTILDLDKP